MYIPRFEVALYPSYKFQQLLHFDSCLFTSITLTYNKPLIKMIANLEKYNNPDK